MSGRSIHRALYCAPLLGLFALLAPLTACTKQQAVDRVQTAALTHTTWESQYDRIDPADLPDNVVDMISKQWMVVTAGKPDSVNSMVINWGAIGYIWDHPAAFIFVRNSRYTYQFLEREGRFTLSVFPEQFRGAEHILGTKTGRASDKIRESGLTLMQTPSGQMSYKEARLIIECKTMMVQDLDYNKALGGYRDDIGAAYQGNPSHHQMFISEITNIWLKK
ncbi:MAG: flavin reductase [Acidobacteriaceae bacterium]|nr:flavin reductase [Acidobacteriaceae bacterium]